MRKAFAGALIAAFTLGLPLVASAGSWTPPPPTTPKFAVVVCGDNGGSVQVVAASGSGVTVPTVGSDCSAALGALFGSFLRIVSVVQTTNGWAYTLAGGGSPSD